MALTFGTLLSSQRADAQKLDPSGPRPWLDVQHYAGFQLIPDPGPWSGGPPGPRGAGRTLHDLLGPLQGGPGVVLRSLEGVARQPWWERVPRLGCHVGHTQRDRLVGTGQATPAGRN